MNLLYTKSIISFILILITINLFGDNEKVYQNDKRIILQEGLSQSRILSIIEDERGFMWFGTADGLNRWDGYTFKIFRNIYNDSTSIPNNVINSIAEDMDGNMWIGTNNGIAFFNPYTEIFKSIKENDSTAIALGANIITACVVDNQGNVWCGTDGFGIIKINHLTHKKEYFFYSKTNSLQLNKSTALFIDSQNRLWIGGYLVNSISAYNISSKQLAGYKVQGISKRNGTNQKTYSFYEDFENRIWTSIVDYHSAEGNLYYLDKDQDEFLNYGNLISGDIVTKFSDSFNTIRSITGDDKGNIWFTSLLSGIFRFRFGENPTAYYKESPSKDSRINCIYLTKNGILWLGTNGSGIEISMLDNMDFNLVSYKFNKEFTIESIRTFAEDENNFWVGGYYGLAKMKKDFSQIETIDNSSVYTIVNSPNNKNILWTGSEGGGLQPLNKYSNTFSSIDYVGNEINLPFLDYIFVIYPLSDTLFLLGTNNGLFSYNPITNTTRRYPYYRSSHDKATNVTVRTISEDRFGNILIGYVQGGIGKLDLKKHRVVRFKVIPDLQSFNNYNPINCIYNAPDNKYWIATSNGLLMYDTGNEDIHVFTEIDGLPNSHIYGIVPDEDENLWMSTNNGLSCYYPKENIFRNYDISDGLQSNEFNTGAYFKAGNGDIFFGGIVGFNYFNPKNIKRNSIVPKLVISAVKIGNSYLNVSKQYHNKCLLTIQPDQEVFTIEFAGLSYINSIKNQYKYRIKELDKEWINLGNQHQITFNNLTPGTYTLEILASNNHGLWLKEPYKCTIKVMPTFFESKLFKWLIGILIIIILILGVRVRLYQVTNQKNKLQLLVKQQTAALTETNKILQEEVLKHSKTTKELISSNNTKDKFLSIIAHDIIGPLGVVQGFSDLLIDKNNNFNDEDKYSFYKAINLTSRRLTSLLTNLLQWSRLQRGSLDPDYNEVNLNEIVIEVVSLLHSNIKEKEIVFINNLENNILVLADKNMALTIIRNLISNAIKFTPSMGTITIKSKSINNVEQISITDTGIGIGEENFDKLFNPESNYTTKGTNNEPGTGLGLGLVKEFVTLNKGELWFESTLNQGTTFYFTIPKFVMHD